MPSVERVPLGSTPVEGRERSGLSRRGSRLWSRPRDLAGLANPTGTSSACQLSRSGLKWMRLYIPPSISHCSWTTLGIKMLRASSHLLKITAGDTSSQQGDWGARLHIHHILSFVPLGSTSSYTFREQLSYWSTKYLFLGKAKKRRVIGMKYSPCSCTGSWSCNICSSAPFPVAQSRVFCAPAAPLLVLWLIWWHAPDPPVWGISALTTPSSAKGCCTCPFTIPAGQGTVDTQAESLGYHVFPPCSTAPTADHSQLLCQEEALLLVYWSLKKRNPKCPGRNYRI